MASMLLSQLLDILGNRILSWFMLTDFFKTENILWGNVGHFFFVSSCSLDLSIQESVKGVGNSLFK